MPASITLPPPWAITRSQPSSRAIRVAWSTRWVVGSPLTLKTTERTPASLQPLRQRLASAVGAPQDHEGTAAEVPGQGGDLLRRAAPEEDAPGGGELERHGSPASG